MSVLKQANSYAQVKQASNTDLFADKTALSILVATYDAIVGSSADVLAGIATHSSLQSAINAIPNEGKILFLNTTVTENVTIDKTVTVEGKGHGSKLNGTMTFQSNADYCLITGLRIGDDVTFSLGSDGNFFMHNWLASTKTVIDNGVANNILYIQE